MVCPLTTAFHEAVLRHFESDEAEPADVAIATITVMFTFLEALPSKALRLEMIARIERELHRMSERHLS